MFSYFLSDSKTLRLPHGQGDFVEACDPRVDLGCPGDLPDFWVVVDPGNGSVGVASHEIEVVSAHVIFSSEISQD